MADSSFQNQTDEELKLVKEAEGLINDAYDAARKKFKERRKYNDLYYVNDQEYQSKKKDHQAKFLSPQYHSFAEQKISLYAQGVTGTDVQPFFLFGENGNQHIGGAANALTRMCYNDLMEDYYYETNYKTSYHYTVEGFAIEKPWWNFSTYDFYPDQEERMVFDDELGTVQVQQFQPPPIPRVEHNHASVVSIAPSDLWVDPCAKNEKQLRYCIERIIMPLSEVKKFEKAGVYKNTDLLEDTKFPIRRDFGDFLSSVSHERRDYIQFYEQQLGFKNIDKDDPLVELLLIWRKGYFYVIGNERIVLSDPMSFPWLKRGFPFVFYSNFPSNYRFDGISDFYFNEALIKETNKVGNLLIDNVYKHLNSIYFVNGLLDGEDIAKIKSGEGNIVVESATADIVTQFRPELPSQAVVNFLDGMVNTAKDSMSVSDLMAGESPGSEFRTTGSIQIAAQLGQIRSAVKLQMLANRKREVGKQLLHLYKHFLTPEKAVEVAGANAEELMAIKNADVTHEYAIDINIAPAADILRSQELQAMRALFSDFSQMPEYDRVAAGREIAVKSGLFRNAAEHFPVYSPEQAIVKNDLDAEQAGMPANPGFAGSVAVQSPDAGGQAPTDAAGNVAPEAAPPAPGVPA